MLDNFNEKILLIENIRFYPDEEKNDTNFAKHLHFCTHFQNLPTLSAKFLSNVRRLHADVSSPKFLLICKFGPTTQYLHVADKLANQISLLNVVFPNILMVSAQQDNK